MPPFRPPTDATPVPSSPSLPLPFLSDAGAIDILRKGKPVPAAEARGVIRLRLRIAEEV